VTVTVAVPAAGTHEAVWDSAWVREIPAGM